VCSAGAPVPRGPDDRSTGALIVTDQIPKVSSRLMTLDPVVMQHILDLNVWAVRQGLQGRAVDALFDQLCRRLVIAGVPLWGAFAGMRTLHPQWEAYGYTWARHLNAMELAQWERSRDRDWLSGPHAYLIEQMRDPAAPDEASLRRRLAGPEAHLDFPILKTLAAAGATDFLAHVRRFGTAGDPSRGSGVAYAFATDRPGGFSDDDLTLLQSVLPAVSIAVMAQASHTIAASLLGAYLGADAGQRVHAGAVERGALETIRAVLWYADVRGFTPIADAWPGPILIDLLDSVFETLAAALRPRGGQVLKFLGDGMLAILPFEQLSQHETCRLALDAAGDATVALDALNAGRREAGKPTAAVDLALHCGEVLYGNVGAVDRLDFTVIGPAVNEVARIEALCEPLDRKVLVSAEFAAAAGDTGRLELVGRHTLRGVREAREIFALVLQDSAAAASLHSG
jgi:adenylate cyclase